MTMHRTLNPLKLFTFREAIETTRSAIATAVRLPLFAAVMLLAALPSQGQDFRTGPVDTEQAIAELVAGVGAVTPGQTFDVALRLELDPHWHVYWKNPGDTGLATTVDWTVAEGVKVGELEFPTPEKIITPPDFVSYGYEGELFFLAKVTVPEGLSVGETLSLKADASWLACEKICIPGGAKLALELPVVAAGEAVVSSPWTAALQEARANLPAVPDGAAFTFEALDSTISAQVEWGGLAGIDSDALYFYVEEEGLVSSDAPQNFVLSGSSLIISMQKSEYHEGEVDRLTGVLVSESGFPAAGGVRAVFLDSARVPGVGASTGSAAVPAAGIGFAQALLFAFLGGVILNLMPCVFPILSVKVLGFVQQSGEDDKKALAHGLVFAGGVVASFWALAGALIALRAGGESLGWGFQLQSPYFVGILLLVMFLLGLSLAGVFEVGTSAVSLAGKVKGDGYGGSFFSGVLATAVATPCTGPFMGPALGFALTLSAVQSLTVFTFLALGMAAPYVLLSSFPKLLKKLPRPGPWMETFKQLMSFPMFATCIWLVWLMGAHVGNDGLIMVLGGLLVVAIGAWVYGRWSVPSKPAVTRRVSAIAAAAIAVLGIWMLIPSEEATQSAGAEYAGGPDQYGVVWESFSPEMVAAARAEGKPVFIDFTANWCLTCKANKAVVFTSDEVKQRFRELDVVMVKADWTKRNPVITQALEEFGRSGVPLNILYDGKTDTPMILPELLNPGIVLDALDKVENTAASVAIR